MFVCVSSPATLSSANNVLRHNMSHICGHCLIAWKLSRISCRTCIQPPALRNVSHNMHWLITNVRRMLSSNAMHFHILVRHSCTERPPKSAFKIATYHGRCKYNLQIQVPVATTMLESKKVNTKVGHSSQLLQHLTTFNYV